MLVGYTITSYPPAVGGAQVHLHELVRHLSTQIEPRVVTLWSENRTDWLTGTTVRAPSRTKTYTLDGVPVTRLGFSSADRLRMAPAALAYPLAQPPAVRSIAARYLPKIDPLLGEADVIHNVRVGREPLSYASLQLARKRGVPFVFDPLHHPRWVGWFYRVYMEIYRAADVVMALTESEKQVLTGLGVSPERIVISGRGPILAPTADAERFKTRYSLDGPIALFLGQKYPYKGYPAMLAAAPLVWERHPDTRFVFIGPRTEQSRSAFEQAHDSRILELDTVSLEDKTDALAACTLLCVPSTQESFGGVYTEAWARGKPVIGGVAPAIQEVVEHERDGLIAPQEPEAIAAAITRLLDEPELAASMGALGKEKVEARYGWDRIAERTLDAYASAIRRASGSTR